MKSFWIITDNQNSIRVLGTIEKKNRQNNHVTGSSDKSRKSIAIIISIGYYAKTKRYGKLLFRMDKQSINQFTG